MSRHLWARELRDPNAREWVISVTMKDNGRTLVNEFRFTGTRADAEREAARMGIGSWSATVTPATVRS